VGVPPGGDRPLFRKGSATAPAGYFRWEAAGLAWLAAAPGGAPVPEVYGHGEDYLDLERLTFVNPTPQAAEAFGAALARTHDAGAPAYGSPPEGWEGDGFLGPATELLPLQLRPATFWGEFYAEQRLLQLNVPGDELARRRAEWQPPHPRYTRGVLAKYSKLVSSASRGAITD